MVAPLSMIMRLGGYLVQQTACTEGKVLLLVVLVHGKPKPPFLGWSHIFSFDL